MLDRQASKTSDTKQKTPAARKKVRFRLFVQKECPFCERARRCLYDRNINFQVIYPTPGQKEKLCSSIAPRKLTYPMIFEGNKLIGGSDELLKLLENKPDSAQAVSSSNPPLAPPLYPTPLPTDAGQVRAFDRLVKGISCLRALMVQRTTTLRELKEVSTYSVADEKQQKMKDYLWDKKFQESLDRSIACYKEGLAVLDSPSNVALKLFQFIKSLLCEMAQLNLYQTSMVYAYSTSMAKMTGNKEYFGGAMKWYTKINIYRVIKVTAKVVANYMQAFEDPANAESLKRMACDSEGCWHAPEGMEAGTQALKVASLLERIRKAVHASMKKRLARCRCARVDDPACNCSSSDIEPPQEVVELQLD